MKASKWLITGASGLLGATALKIISNKTSAVGIYNQHPISLPGVTTFQTDLTKSDAVNKHLEELRPDVILHTAAATNVDWCEDNKSAAWAANVDSVKSLASYCAKSGAKLIHISTDAFFDQEGLIGERADPHPKNYYAQTKLDAEKVVTSVLKDYLIIRTNIYGWNFQKKLSLAEWMLACFQEQKKTPLFYDVTYTPILTNTLVDLILGLQNVDAVGVFNATTDRAISKLEFGQLLCREFKLSPEFIVPTPVDEVLTRVPRSKFMALDNSKIKKTLNISALTVEDDLSRFRELGQF